MNDRNEMPPEQALSIAKHLLEHAAPRAQILIKAAALRVLVGEGSPHVNAASSTASTGRPSVATPVVERLLDFRKRMVAKTEEPELHELLGTAAAEIKRLRARLECDHIFQLIDGKMTRVEADLGDEYDGIACRDETIRQQDRIIADLRQERNILQKLCARRAAALEEMARQELSADMSVDQQLDGDFEGAYNHFVELARDAMTSAPVGSQASDNSGGSIANTSSQAFVPCQNANRVCDHVPECAVRCATRAACLAEGATSKPR